MNNENVHNVLSVPPLTHALHKWNEAEGILSYEYNGVDIIKLMVPGEVEDLGFRHGSDGSIQSVQYMQQIYITADRSTKAKMIFTLSDDTVSMRTRRAVGNEAILAQHGKLLIHGVNGLYDVNQDLLIELNGCSWRWSDNKINSNNQGQSIIEVEIELCEMPLYINLRMHYYRKHLGYNYYEPWKLKPKMKTIAGWCSWEAYRRDININKINRISSFLADKLKDYGLEYIQVDDGYQKMPLPYHAEGSMCEGWMTTDKEKFPGGHQSIINSIEEQGLIPAIWTNANITNTDFSKYHKEDVLWNADKALKGEWIDYLYSCTEECLEGQVKPIFKAYRELGYKYVKIDAIRHLLFDGLHEAVRLGLMSNEAAEGKFRSYMLATKEGLGQDIFYLASWGEMHELIGVADACRISMDANPTWAGIRMQLFESARWFHAQRILFQIDPDHVCIRTKPEWAKSILSLISLSGALCMLSDTEDAYTEEKLSIIRKTIPGLKSRTAETGHLELSYPAYTWTKLHGFAVQSHETPVEMEDVSMKEALDMAGIFPTMNDAHPFSTLWSFHIGHLSQTWCILGRFATMPLGESHVNLVALGLDAEKDYIAFDFWKKKYLGIISKEIPCEALELGCCQIVALHPITNIPKVIASSRHISMDVISVVDCNWSGNSLFMTLNSAPNSIETYFVYVPQNYIVKQIIVDATSEIQYYLSDNCLSFDIKFTESNVEVQVIFNTN